MPASTTMESIGSHLHPQSNIRIHLLPKKSKLPKSNLHPMSNATILVLPIPLVNNYELVVQGNAPSMLLIPSSNANGQNKFIPRPSLLY